MSIQQHRIDEACSQVFKNYPEISKAAGAGANAAFRFLADNVVTALGSDADLESIYGTLFGRISLAKAGVSADDPDREKLRHVAGEAFKLGMECGKSVHSTLKQRKQEGAPLDFNHNSSISVVDTYAKA